jgi:hypothetical protein
MHFPSVRLDRLRMDGRTIDGMSKDVVALEMHSTNK